MSLNDALAKARSKASVMFSASVSVPNEPPQQTELVSEESKGRGALWVTLAVLIWAIAAWSLAYALLLLTHDLALKNLLLGATFVSALVVPTAWFAFTLSYTGQHWWLTRRLMYLIAVPPVLSIALVLTNGWHGWVWTHAASVQVGPYFPMIDATTPR